MRKFSFYIAASLICIAFFLNACLPDPLEVKGIPQVVPQIVVSSQIIPDQSLMVILTRTISALEASNESDPQDLLDQIAINDADVTLTGPSGTYELLFLENGIYGGVLIPFQPGEEYELNVDSESFGKVRAVTTVMPQVSFTNIELDLYYNDFGDTLAQVNYSFQDITGPSWYMINVQEVEQEDFIENLINPRAFTRLIDDLEFDGKSYVEQFRVFPRDYAPGDTVAVSFANISAEYYNFMKLRMDNRFSFIQFLSEPVNYPTNVEGGKGFFNLYLPDIRTFVLE